MASTISLLLLPTEVLSFIFKKLQFPDLLNVMCTCKILKNLIINDNTIWRLLRQQSLIVRNSLGNNKPITLSWYDQLKVSHNWCKGIYKSKVLIHHYTNYMPWIKFVNDKLLVSWGSELHCYGTDKKGMPNCRVAQWKVDVPKIKRQDVRTNDISKFILKDNIIVCGNRDGCVAVYELCNTGYPDLLVHIEDCHENGLLEVSAVQLINRDKQCPLVITGSNYSPILQFFYIGTRNSSNDTQKAREFAIPDEKGIKCIDVDSNQERLALGLNGNSKAVVLDVNTGKLLVTADTTRNPRSAVRDVQWHDENTIIYVTYSGRLQFIDVRSQLVVYDQLDPFQSALYCLKSDGDRAVIVGSAEYSRCVLYDVRNRKHHEQIYFTQKKISPVYSLDFDSTKLIAAVDKGAAVLNFNIDPSSVEQRDYSYIFEMLNR